VAGEHEEISHTAIISPPSNCDSRGGNFLNQQLYLSLSKLPDEFTLFCSDYIIGATCSGRAWKMCNVIVTIDHVKIDYCVMQRLLVVFLYSIRHY
jgi:hypothetical protein